MVGVVQSNGYIGGPQRTPELRAGKDHILHGGSPQRFDLLLSQDPADRVRHIGLAAAVGAHDGRYAVMKFEFYLVCKGFESLYFYAF